MKNKNLLCFFLLLLATVSCNKDDEENQVVAEDSRLVEVSTNPADPLLLRVTQKDNTVVQYFGDKKTDGKAIACTSISVQKPTATFPTLIEIDKQGRPFIIHSPDGSFVKMNWLSNEEVRILAVTPKGEVQVSVPINITKLGKRNAPASGGMSPEKRVGDLAVAINLLPASGQEIGGTQSANLQVKVERCGQPFNNGYVDLLMGGNEGKYIGHLYGTPLTNGISVFKIENPNEDIKLSEICSSIEDALGNLCDFVDPFTKDMAGQAVVCAEISLAIDFAVFGPTGESVPLFAGCEALFGSLSVYCATLGGSGGPGFPSVLNNLCKLAKKAENTPKEFTFKPIVYVQGEPAFEGQKTGSYSVGGPFPLLTVTLPNKPKIEDFTTVPLDPAPKQSYTASAQIYCGKAGAKALISVVGTDGYTKSSTITLPEGNSKITIAVPGGNGGVQDRLTVEIAGVAKMYASIVF